MPILPFLLYVTVTSFTPGPNNIIAMVNSHEYGIKKTVFFCLGVSTGFFIIMLLCSFFNLFLSSVVPKAEFFMAVAGVLYMIYLAVKVMASNRGHSVKRKKQRGYLIGVFLQFVNPKGILYGMTVAAAFIMPNVHTSIGLIGCSLFLGMVGFLSTFCWCLFGSVFQKFLSKYDQSFRIIMGLLLITSAVSIVLEQQ